MLRITLEAADLFISYLEGKAGLSEVFNHRAYQTVFSHSRLFGEGVTEEDVALAISGKPAKFPGLGGLDVNMVPIRSLMATIAENKEAWALAAYHAVARVVEPRLLEEIWVYPMFGYDLGIGHRGAVCINLNERLYTENHAEFLYFMMHEAFHVAYERIHVIPGVGGLHTPEDWARFLDTMVQNEGYATYVALEPRQRAGHTEFGDYAVLKDPVKVQEHIARLDAVRRAILHRPVDVGEWIKRAFGPDRLTYRVGCELVRRVRDAHGHEAVRAGVYQDGREFWQNYAHLLRA